MRLPLVFAWFLWPLIVSGPLVFSNVLTWTAPYGTDEAPSPVGLGLGLASVLIGHAFTVLYYRIRTLDAFARKSSSTWTTGAASPDTFWKEASEHVRQVEGFALLGAYLTVYWMSGRMRRSYYDFAGGIEWDRVGLQLLVQDGLQFAMHVFEHKVSKALYRTSHKPHHQYTSPRFFDSFRGSITDTLLMVLGPLFITSRLIECNVWSYMTFGCLYVNGLCLIHSEHAHPWEPAFRRLGIGTSADHHAHHRLFVKNYGHLFTYFDRLSGSYVGLR